MSTRRVWLWSDLHAGHEKSADFRLDLAPPPGVPAHGYQFDIMEHNYLLRVGVKDHVYFLGDVAFTKAALERIGTWPGTKHLIMGNHETDREVELTDLMKVFSTISSLMKYKGFWLSHSPVHPDHIRGTYGINIHGHLHNEVIDDSRFVNVSVERTGYCPIDLDSLRYAIGD